MNHLLTNLFSKDWKPLVMVLTGFLTLDAAYGQTEKPKLHVSTRWEECSFQLDPSLTREAWTRFTREAGMVAYFRPLSDAKPLGKHNFEVALLQWGTAIDDASEAWNNTFVHPDTTHWLKEGPRLAVPGLTGRVGITDDLDVGVYWTINPAANYGIAGAQVQYAFLNKPDRPWKASARLGFSSLYGPEDLDLDVYGADVVVSREFALFSNQLMVSPYAGASAFVSHTREKTSVVNLNDVNIAGMQVMAGATAKFSFLRLGVEYNVGPVNTLSFKMGIGFFNNKRTSTGS